MADELLVCTDMVGQLTLPERCNGWIQALQEGQTGMEKRGCCPFCEKAVGVNGALPWDRWEAAEGLWVGDGGHINVCDVVVSVCC